MLKSVFAVFLSVLMFVSGLMPQNDVEELGKLPQLFQHLQYHRSPQGGALSLKQFLGEHYSLGGAVYRYAPSPEHDKLPLHGQHRIPNLEYVVPAARLLVVGQVHHWPARLYRLATAPRYSCAYSPALLQPPRA